MLTITHTIEGTDATEAHGVAVTDILTTYGWKNIEADKWHLPYTEGLPADWHTIGETVTSLHGIGITPIVNAHDIA